MLYNFVKKIIGKNKAADGYTISINWISLRVQLNLQLMNLKSMLQLYIYLV